MGNSFNHPGDYWIEISGWGLDNSFFVERTELSWTAEGEKRVQLRRSLQEGSIVFVRLLSSEPSNGSVPLAFQVREVVPMDCGGRCQITLAKLHPRCKVSPEQKNASKELEDARTERNVLEFEVGMEHEEVLR